MGTDFFYGGKLPEPALQKMVIELVQSYEKNLVMVDPILGLNCRAVIEHGSEKTYHRSYPFNYFGVIQWPGGLYSRSQFVFDREAGGELVTLLKFPNKYGISPIDDYDTKDMFIENDSDLYARSGGYCRMIGGGVFGFAFLLNLIRLRYWKDLSVSDDYDETKEIGKMVENFGLVPIMKDWRHDYSACQRIFENEYNRHVPEQKSSVKPKKNLKVVPPNVMEISLDTIEMSIRTSNCLRNAGIKTVGELIKFTPNDVRKIKNFGRRSLNEINEFLEDLGVHLKSE